MNTSNSTVSEVASIGIKLYIEEYILFLKETFVALLSFRIMIGNLELGSISKGETKLNFLLKETT